MGYTLEFELKGLPFTLNKMLTVHWAKKKAEVDKWCRCVKIATEGKIPPAPLEKAILTMSRHSSAPPDDDNMRASFKPIVDALRKLKIIKDDKLVNIGSPNVKWYYMTPGKGFVRIKVEEVISADENS